MATLCISDLTSKDVSLIHFNEAKRKGKCLYKSDKLEIVYAEDENVAYLLGDIKEVKNISLDLNDYDIVITNKESADYLCNNNPSLEYWPYYVYAYPLKDKIDVSKDNFKVLDDSYYDIVRANYDLASDEELKAIFLKGEIFGLFEGDELAGFIGIHQEGTMGLLEVFEKFRGKNYGYILEANLVNYLVLNDRLPYCDVHIENKYSINIQNKLGMLRSEEPLYWIFKKDE